MRNGIDQRIEIKRRQVGIFRLDEHHIWRVIPGQVDEVGHIVVEVGESDAILCPERLANDNFVDIIEFVPILVLNVGVFDERFEFGTAGNGHVQRFSSEERFQIEQIEIVVVH